MKVQLCNSMAYELRFLTERLNSYMENQELSAGNDATNDLLIWKNYD